MKFKKLFGLVLLIGASLLIKVLVWDSSENRWLIKDLFYKPSSTLDLSLAPVFTNTEINDASKLNAVRVERILQPTSVKEIQKIVQYAGQKHKAISLSGARHSMGGQNLMSDALQIDITKFKKIVYNPADQTVTVQSGATWKQIQQILGHHGRALRVMQDSNIFTVGGSLALNVHGKDPRFGSLIESVNYFKMVLPNTQEVTCSRTLNSELFRAAIGGLGLFGVITSVNLKTIPNKTYKYQQTIKNINQLIPSLKAYSQRPSIELLEAQLSIDQKHLLREAQIYYYETTSKQLKLSDKLSGENQIWLRKAVYRFSRANDLGRYTRWAIQKTFSGHLEPTYITRNSAMAAPVRFLELEDKKSTDILQEYFLPIDHANEFIILYRELLKKHKLELLNVTVRTVKGDREALVSYADAPVMLAHLGLL